MRPLGQLPPTNFIQSKKIQQIFSVLPDSMFVGGCVRDALMGIYEVFDIDIATKTQPLKSIELLRQSGFKVIETGLKHGTITVVCTPFNIEITTLRTDKSTDGRHAEIEFSDSWLEDAKRRDFQINALYADIEGVVYDPFDGIAFSDIASRTVTFIGFADDRIKEDALRILRYFRFYSRFGGAPDKDALGACRRNSYLIKNLSSERISSELQKILLAKTPEKTIQLMASCGIFEQLGCDSLNLDYLRQIVWLESHGVCMDEIYPNWLRRLIALFDGNADNLLGFASDLKLSNKEKKFLSQVVHSLDEPNKILVKYKSGIDVALSSVLLSWAKTRSDNPRIDSLNTEYWYNKVKEVISFEAKPLPLKGKDLLDIGLLPGKQIHEFLQKADDIFISSGFSLTKEDLLGLLDFKV